MTVNGPDAESEIAQQVTQIGDQLAQDVDAIIVAPCDTDAVSGALESASGEIPVFFIDQDVDFPGKTSFVGTSNVDAAKRADSTSVKKSARMQRLSSSMDRKARVHPTQEHRVTKKVLLNLELNRLRRCPGITYPILRKRPWRTC